MRGRTCFFALADLSKNEGCVPHNNLDSKLASLAERGSVNFPNRCMDIFINVIFLANWASNC